MTFIFPSPIRRRLRILRFAGIFILGSLLSHPPQAEILPPGHRPLPHTLNALVGGKVVVNPGWEIENAVLVLNGDLIQSVGASLDVPANARVWDMKGKTIYAGFVDPYLPMDSLEIPENSGKRYDETPSEALRKRSFRFKGVRGDELDPGKYGPGAELESVLPDRAVADHFTPDEKQWTALRKAGFTSANVVSKEGVFTGSSAFVLLSDDNPNRSILNEDLFQIIRWNLPPNNRRENQYPKSLMGVISASRQSLLDAQHYRLAWNHYRAQKSPANRPEWNPALESLQPILNGTQKAILETGHPILIEQAREFAREFGLQLNLVATGREWLRPDVAAAFERNYIVPLDFHTIPKLPEDEDWEALDLEELRRWDWDPQNPELLHRKNKTFAFTTYRAANLESFRKNLTLAVERGLPKETALAAITVTPARLCGMEDQLGAVESGKWANLTVVDGDDYFDPKNKVAEVWIRGVRYPVDEQEKDGDADKGKEAASSAAPSSNTEESMKPSRNKLTADSPMKPRGPIVSPETLLVKNATLWTCGPSGTIENGDMLIVNGRIQLIAESISLDEAGGAIMVLDAQNRHLTPGLIDAHSHSMILDSVNENTLPSTAMVRIGDVVDSESENIYRQLAGGLTIANLLHGSANPIGGQNAVIKLKDGASPEDLKMKEAPPGIKFALGENVKQSNWGSQYTTRFPQSRMGVPVFMENRFIAAREYQQAWNRHRAQGGLPPRRDLELEALMEILEGERWIHCHSYRQDEILMFLRVMERFDVQVGTLQHVLEGYKIANEIARHGAGASCFSDWWAYKYEVVDAIPYAGALMQQRGALVSFNSDSSDLARRMNLEAAKAVKYGGASEQTALNFVTINPAKQLRIDRWVGSLEPGKHGDFVLWSGHPLNSGSICVQTWIEGKKYFDRHVDAERKAWLQSQRQALLDKAKAIISKSKDARKSPGENNDSPDDALYDYRNDHDHHCLDCGTGE